MKLLAAIAAACLCASAMAQVQIGKNVQIGSSTGGGAVTPATALVLKGMGTVNGVGPATPGIDYVIPSGNVATANGFAVAPAGCPAGQASNTFDSHGNATGCTPISGGGSAPAGTFNDLQIFGTSSSLAADTGNLTNNSTTHNFHQKQLNGIPYAGNYTTGSNGIPNAFAATGAGVIINDSENAGDTTAFGGNNTTIFDMSSTGLGARLHNCAVNLFTVPSRVGVGNCWSDLIYTDVPTTASGQGGQPFHQLGTFTSGPGYNVGPISGGGTTGIDQGWAFDGGLNIAIDAYRNGISNAVEINSNNRKQGDFQNFESRLWCYGGNTEPAGEGCVNISLQGGQQAVFSTGTITSTTGTGDLTPATTANQISAGNFLVDTQTARASGTLTVTGSQAWAESTYLNTLATAGGLTPSTGDCVTTSVIHRSSVAGTPQSVTATCTVGLLGPVSTGIAYLASNETPEQVKITSAPAAVSGVQTLTLLAYLPHEIGSNLIQGGTKGCLSFDANLSINGRSSYYVFGSKDSTHFIYGFLIHGGLQGNTIPMIGDEPETLSTPSNGYHIYPCAQVAYINADSPGAAFHLEEHDIPFAIGDTVEFPSNPSVQATQLALDQGILTPSSGGGSNSIHANFFGPGVNGNYHPFSLINGNNPSMYLGTGGGWANAPKMMNIFGPYSCGICFSNPPAVNGQSIIFVNDVSTSNYGLFDTSAGKITANALLNQIELSKGMLIGGNLTVNGSFQLGGHFSAGDITTTNIPSDTNPPLTVAEQYVADNTCRGLYFTMTPGTTPWGHSCAYHFNDGGDAYGLVFDVGASLTRALTLTIGHAGDLHAALGGDLTTNGNLNLTPNGSANRTIDFGAGFGNAAIYLFDGGTGARTGWSQQSSEMQFFTGSTAGNHYSWNKGGDVQAPGTNELMRLMAPTGALLIGTTTDNGVDKLQVNGSISVAGPITAGGTGHSIATGTASNSDLAGKVTLVAGAGTQALAGTYTTAPIVVCSDTTAAAAVKCVATTTTITFAGTGTDVINYILIGLN